MGLTSFIKDLTTKDPQPAKLAVNGDKLSEEELLTNRYQNGVNIGAVFVQEKWIDNSLFKENTDTGGSELGALKSWGDHPNLDELRAKWEDHWQNFVTDEDLDQLKSRGINAARIPIGFYSLGESSLLKNTEFADYADVYRNSWHYVAKLVERLASRGITALIDMHALPGGANGDEHSGTSSGKAGLWAHSSHRETAISTYRKVAELIDQMPNVVSLQLVNEAPYGESKCPNFYLDSQAKIRSDYESLVLVISDGWDCENLSGCVEKWDEQVSKDRDGATCGFVVDTHVYRTFNDKDHEISANQHIENARNSVQANENVDIIVGEWSCTLDEQSWQKSEGNRDELQVEFGKEQLKNFAQLAGNYFWTLKFGQGNGGSWDWRTMSEKGVTLPKIESGRGDKEGSLRSALEQHSNYWRSQNQDEDWEDFRFEDGFRQGWDDAEQFAEFHGSRPGRIAALKAARTHQHAEKRGSSDKLWVFGQAYVQGIRARTNA